MNRKYLIWAFFTLMIMVNAFVIFQACLPANSSSSWSEAIVEVISDISGGSVEGTTPTPSGLTVSEFVRKSVGHFSLFGLNGLFTYLFFYYLYEDKGYKYYYLHVLWAALVGIFVASLTEVIQLFVPGRCGDIQDVFLDVGGFLSVMLLALLVTSIIKNVQHKKRITS